jgi:hypothetical protein
VTRVRDVALALACAAGAVALRTSAETPPVSGATALGGLRPLVVDSLFLRAEALRRLGRHDEVATLYRRVLDLEPDSVAAVDFLAATEAYDLRAEAPTEEGRVRWHASATGLVERALARRPEEPRLRWRLANLLVSVPDGDPAVARALERAGRDRTGEALRHLAVSVRDAESLPRLGLQHLDDLARLSPRVAAERLARGEDPDRVDEALAVGEDLFVRRGEALARLLAHPEARRTAYDRLHAGLTLVRATRAARAGEADVAHVRALLAEYREEVGDDALARTLEPLLR